MLIASMQVFSNLYSLTPRSVSWRWSWNAQHLLFPQLLHFLPCVNRAGSFEGTTRPQNCCSLPGTASLCSLCKVYWGYLRARANSFKASFVTGEDLALVRLACLSRVSDRQEFMALQLGRRRGIDHGNVVLSVLKHMSLIRLRWQ